ncbi:hypothetical protein DERP_000185 [Dermatophagoides pteronyssinus]|uniref:Uncharacterized protein n=1 Tax=Dermatophagoides pteronyssinus TaxID=6956 RepID=A0ABQ8J026_DERPT|nr:hypothetical protein DERP_000185 [Dermatophagoides pteronyssinus]
MATAEWPARALAVCNDRGNGIEPEGSTLLHVMDGPLRGVNVTAVCDSRGVGGSPLQFGISH